MKWTLFLEKVNIHQYDNYIKNLKRLKYVIEILIYFLKYIFTGR